MRISIHSGQAIVFDIGSSTKLNYAVVGDMLNVVQRLAQPGNDVARLTEAASAGAYPGEMVETR